MPVDPFFLSRITKSGNVSALNKHKAGFKAQVFIDKLVRFDIANAQGAQVPDGDLARILNRSIKTIVAIRSTSRYLRRKVEIVSGVPIGSQEGVELTVEHHRLMMKEMMPMALRTMADVLMSTDNSIAGKRLKLEASKEILDREGSLPKISRNDINAKVAHDYKEADGVSALLLEAMGEKPGAEAPDSVLEAIRINQKFSQSETLTPEEQEKAMLTLEALNKDLTGKPVN